MLFCSLNLSIVDGIACVKLLNQGKIKKGGHYYEKR